MTRCRWGLVLVIAFSAACGGNEHEGHSAGEQPEQTAAACKPSAGSLQIAAQQLKFDKECLAAGEGKAFSISFDNRDGTEPHNIAVKKSHRSKEVIFRGETFLGPRVVTYNVPALAAGEYHFHCEVHPDQMQGTLSVH